MYSKVKDCKFNSFILYSPGGYVYNPQYSTIIWLIYLRCSNYKNCTLNSSKVLTLKGNAYFELCDIDRSNNIFQDACKIDNSKIKNTILNEYSSSSITIKYLELFNCYIIRNKKLI